MAIEKTAGKGIDTKHADYAVSRLPGVRGFVMDAAHEYAFTVDTDGERPWRAIVNGVCYLGFESRLEALTFAAIKTIEGRKC